MCSAQRASSRRWHGPTKFEPPEDDIIKLVRKRLAERKPRYLEYIADLKCSVTKSIEEMGLLRLAMGIIPEDQDLRICRTLILKEYERLETIGSADSFHLVFVDVVRGMYVSVLSKLIVSQCLQLIIGSARHPTYCTVISVSTIPCGIENIGRLSVSYVIGTSLRITAQETSRPSDHPTMLSTCFRQARMILQTNQGDGPRVNHKTLRVRLRAKTTPGKGLQLQLHRPLTC